MERKYIRILLEIQHCFGRKGVKKVKSWNMKEDRNGKMPADDVWKISQEYMSDLYTMDIGSRRAGYIQCKWPRTCLKRVLFGEGEGSQ